MRDIPARSRVYVILERTGPASEPTGLSLHRHLGNLYTICKTDRMRNDGVTHQNGEPADESADLRGEIVDLTERAHVLSFEHGITLRMRHRAMVGLHRRGATIDELAQLSGMPPGEVEELIQNPTDHTRQ